MNSKILETPLREYNLVSINLSPDPKLLIFLSASRCKNDESLDLKYNNVLKVATERAMMEA